ncbi:MAG: glycosyltransferase [Calditrichaeota bacterium]|nr:glycosyltransferase [Calditrichota bacterium]MCB9369629.1 glycosyltransferase [Calditrichota bacterium]
MKISGWTQLGESGLSSDFPLKKLNDAALFAAGGVDPNNGVTALHADSTNFAACMNEAARLAQSGLLLFLPADLLDLADDWQDNLLRAAQDNPDARFFYGDYVWRDKNGDSMQSVRQDVGDVTEREDWGPVWAVRVEWLLSIGGLDEANHKAAFYDLLLKSWGEKTRIHIGGVLAVVPAPKSDTAEAAKRSKLFYPGRGALGGFSYLFMDKETERHTEEVFYNFLKREGAWLEGARSDSPPVFRGGKGGSSSQEFRISVVTPVFNRAKFIGKAIESVQTADISDWEYIIVDNGSTDNTRDVVRSYMAKDPRIKLIENDRNIISVSLNLGVRAAKGKYIAQLDSDDEHLPHTLRTMAEHLDNNPTWGLAISYYELMDEDGNVLPEFGVIKHEQYNRNNILRRDGAGALRCWHRSVILEFGGFDEEKLGHYGEDYDLVLKCGEKYEVGRVHQVCYRYRRHGDNTDVLRSSEMKIQNKTLARLNALERRKKLNKS